MRDDRLPPRKAGLARRAPGMHRPPHFAEAEYAADIRGTLRRLLRYFTKESRLLLLLFMAVIFGTFCSIYAPLLQAAAIDAMTGGQLPQLRQELLYLALCYLLASLSQFLTGQLAARLSQHIVRALRTELFAHIVDLPVRYLDRHSHGDVMSRMTNDVENIASVISSSLPTLCSGLLTVAGTALIMLWSCWQLALLSFLSVFVTIFVTKRMGRVVRRYSRTRQQLLGEQTGMVEEMIAGYRTVVACHHQQAVIRSFCAKSDELTRAGIRQDICSGVMGPFMNSISNAGFVACAAAGGVFALDGMISVGIIAAFLVYIRLFSKPINELAVIYGQLQTAVAGAERVFKVLDEPPEMMAGGAYPPRGRNDIRFEHVSFSYVPGQEVLHDFSLSIPAGRKVALVGATGSGKTTLANLLLRFYDPERGTIWIGPSDLHTIARPALRGSMAIVLQDTVLFSATIRENLLYARPEATEEELWRAARLSRAQEMIAALPQGLDTVLTAGGENISQGQRQLLAITRAFLADPDVLILDEATSNVDTRTEKDIQSAMQELMKNRTSIVIAHRLSTIRDSDLIVVMNEGRIVEQGSHQELLAAGGRYYDLYMTQFRGFAT